MIRKIDNESRMTFPPSYLYIESMVYNMADKFIENYNGGMWNFYEINGMPVMIWGKDKQVKLVNEMNMFEKEVNGQTASLAIMMMAIIHSSYQTKNATIQDRLVELYYNLRDWVLSDDKDTIQERKEFGIDESAIMWFLD